VLNTKLPKNHYKKAIAPDYPNLEDNADGAFIPLAYGVLENIPMVCIDTTLSTYKCADHAIHDFTAVRTERETLLPADYVEDLADGELTIAVATTPYLVAGTYWFVIAADYVAGGSNYIRFSRWNKTAAEQVSYSIDGVGGGAWTEDATHYLEHTIYGRDSLDAKDTRRIAPGRETTWSQLALRDDPTATLLRTRLAQKFVVTSAFYLTKIKLEYQRIGTATGNITIKILSDDSPETQVGAQSTALAIGTSGWNWPKVEWPLRAVELSALYCDIEGAERIGMWIDCSASDATAATVQVTATTIVLVITGGTSAGTNTLTFADADKDTLTELVAFINALAGWEAGALPDGSAASTDLSIIAANACLGSANALALKLPVTIVDGADMLEDLVVTQLKRAPSILDPTALADFKTKRTQAIATYIDSDTTFGEIVGKLETSLLFKFIPLHDGTYAPTVYAADIAEVRPHFFDEHFLSFSIRRNFSAVKSVVKVKYAETPDSQEFKVAEDDSNVARFVYGTDETMEVETYLVSGANAATLAASYLGMYETPLLEVTFEVRGYGLNLIPGKDKVKLTRTNAAYAGGTLAGVLFRIVKLTKKPGTASTEIVCVLDTQTY
jgi:hypothetical protein